MKELLIGASEILPSLWKVAANIAKNGTDIGSSGSVLGVSIPSEVSYGNHVT